MTALATPGAAAVAIVEPLNEERAALLRRTLCNDLTQDEFDLFAGVCRRSGLDPFSKQIYALKRKSKNDRGEWVEKVSIQTGIDGFRVIGARTGELDGQDGPFWCGPDGVWLDVWLSPIPPEAAKVIVYRKGCSRGFVGIAKYWEYAQTYKDGKPSGMWGRMPANQIAKCAEALALRKAFPADLSGLYTSDEMDQADAIEAPVAAPAVAPTQTQPAPAPAVKQLAARVETPAIGDPVSDAAGILALIYRKGGTYPAVIQSINANFGTRHAPNCPWEAVNPKHREAAVGLLNKVPDIDTREELSALLADVAKLEGKETAAVFQAFQVAAKLPESCVSIEDVPAEMIPRACEAFRGRRARLKAAKGKGGA